jgi:peptide/nickel transport system ATP-binding protein
MRRGEIVETGPVRDVLDAPKHPYTQALLDALPSRSKPGELLASGATEAAGRLDASTLGVTAVNAPEDLAFIRIQDIDKLFVRRTGVLRRQAIRLGLAGEPPQVHAVKSASLNVARGEILGLVGESGSGKSTLGRILCGIIPPTSGAVSVGGEPVMEGARKRGTRVQMIFQDPFASLDPRRTIFQSVAEGPIAHSLCTKTEARSYVERWLRAVAFDPALSNRYPHQFSGGQRQRIAIARALAMRPEVIVCDEPVASLDVSIQAQVINLLMELRRHLNLTLLFISHDLSVVHHLCDRVVVMRYGEIIETGSASEIFHAPKQSYTQMLLDAIPKLAS